MSEPAKESPKTSKRSKRRPAMEPLGWDEIVSQPGMGGYLSFLNGPVPLPHLQGPAASVIPDPGAVSIPDIVQIPIVDLSPAVDSVSASALAPEPIQSPHEVRITPGVALSPDVDSGVPESDTRVATDPVVVLAPPINTASEIAAARVNSTPGVFSIPAVPAGRIRIRRCAATHEGHSLGEEVLYQALWKAADPESSESRTIVIGWRGMSQLCRMTPKNCKINTQRLIRKLALEVLSPYNTPESIGTTYRVYSDQVILQRRREAGLEWVVRSRGVEFVDPATGVSIMPICAHTH